MATNVTIQTTVTEIRNHIAAMLAAHKAGETPNPMIDVAQIDANEDEVDYFSVNIGSICRIDTEGKTATYIAKTTEGEVALGKHNGTRFYWDKKLNNDTLEFSVVPIDEDGDENKVVICRDKSRYTPYVRGQRVSMDCADMVALALRGFVEVYEAVNWACNLMDAAEECPVPKKSAATSWAQHADMYWGRLNNGQKRMLAGQALRYAAKNNDFVAEAVENHVLGLQEAEAAQPKTESRIPKKVASKKPKK